MDKRITQLKLNGEQGLNQLLLDSLPHPAMLIHRDRVVLAANRIARDMGARVGDYCWKSFGHRHLDRTKTKADNKKDSSYSGPIYPKCFSCMADEAFERQKPVNNPELEAFGQIWDTWWVPINREIYLHYASNITQIKHAEDRLRKEHDDLERRVEERAQKIRKLSSQLINAQEDERKSIARELHDSIGQSLAAINFGVENALDKLRQGKTEECLKALQAITPFIKHTSDEVRRIHADLHPPLLDDLGIVSTITWFCREFETLYPLMAIEKLIEIDEDEIPDLLKITMYRIMQEAFNNIAKHSKADIIRIVLEKTEAQIEFQIWDNGQGMDLENSESPAKQKGGFGLQNMKERAKLSGGSFSIESAEGKGSSIRVCWPVRTSK